MCVSGGACAGVWAKIISWAANSQIENRAAKEKNNAKCTSDNCAECRLCAIIIITWNRFGENCSEMLLLAALLWKRNFNYVLLFLLPNFRFCCFYFRKRKSAALHVWVVIEYATVSVLVVKVGAENSSNNKSLQDDCVERLQCQAGIRHWWVNNFLGEIKYINKLARLRPTENV